MGRALGGFTQAVRWVGLGSLGWVRDLASLGWVGLNWAEPGLLNEPMHDHSLYFGASEFPLPWQLLSKQKNSETRISASRMIQVEKFLNSDSLLPIAV